MSWWKSSASPAAIVVALFLLLEFSGARAIASENSRGDDFPSQNQLRAAETQAGLDEQTGSQPGAESETVGAQIRLATSWVIQWYIRTEPAERVAWGGLVGCAVLGLGVLCERSINLRRRLILPTDFTARFLDRLHEGKLDCGGALDHCELNPSPAARIALAAVRRWGRPAADLERAVSLAHRVETDRLRRNVGTLLRIAALAPLIGLLGTVFAIGRVLESIPPRPVSASAAIESAGTATAAIAWGPSIGGALTYLSAGIIIATLALVAYDGLKIRIEKLTAALDRVGAETIDAIALAAPPSPPALPLGVSTAKANRTVARSESEGVRWSGPTLHHPHIGRNAGADLSQKYDQLDAGF
jgi:biopolymer transport protein ExbB